MCGLCFDKTDKITAAAAAAFIMYHPWKQVNCLEAIGDIQHLVLHKNGFQLKCNKVDLH